MTMRFSFAAVALTAASLVSSAALAESRTILLPGFEVVNVAGSFVADITVGAEQTIVIEADNPALLDQVRIEIEDGALTATIERSAVEVLTSATEGPVKLHVTAPTLRAVYANAGAAVTAAGPSADVLTFSSDAGASLSVTGAAGTDYLVDASSGASLSLSGNCENLTVRVSSGANVDAPGLSCTTVTADASSGAHADVAASTGLTANASSGAGITVHGAPTAVEQETSGGGGINIKP